MWNWEGKLAGLGFSTVVVVVVVVVRSSTVVLVMVGDVVWETRGCDARRSVLLRATGPPRCAVLCCAVEMVWCCKLLRSVSRASSCRVCTHILIVL